MTDWGNCVHGWCLGWPKPLTLDTTRQTLIDKNLVASLTITCFCPKARAFTIGAALIVLG